MTEKLLWMKYLEDGVDGELRPAAYPGDAGFDMVVSEDAEITPHRITKVKCGICVAVPEGYAAMPIARSSAVLRGILVMPTLIDSGYRGPLFIFAILLDHIGSGIVVVKKGERIAQLLLMPNMAMGLEVKQVKQLPPSMRGENGFGSSGGSV